MVIGEDCLPISPLWGLFLSIVPFSLNFGLANKEDGNSFGLLTEEVMTMSKNTVQESLPNEEWKPIPQAPFTELSNQGRLRREFNRGESYRLPKRSTVPLAQGDVRVNVYVPSLMKELFGIEVEKSKANEDDPKTIEPNRCVDCRTVIHHQSTRCSSCGGKARFLTPELIARNEEMVKLFEGGMRKNAIAKKFGISRERVRQLLNQLPNIKELEAKQFEVEKQAFLERWTNKRINRLVYLAPIDLADFRLNWKAQCDCGNELFVKNPAKRVPQSCGCYASERRGMQGIASRKFSKEDVELMFKMRSEGASTQKIGHHFGVNPVTILYILRGDSYKEFQPEGYEYKPLPRRTWSHNPITEQDVHRICELRNEGLTVPQIAEQVKRNTATVCSVLSEDRYARLRPEGFQYKSFSTRGKPKSKKQEPKKQAKRSIKKTVKHQAPVSRFDEIIARTSKEFARIIQKNTRSS